MLVCLQAIRNFNYQSVLHAYTENDGGVKRVPGRITHSNGMDLLEQFLLDISTQRHITNRAMDILGKTAAALRSLDTAVKEKEMVQSSVLETNSLLRELESYQKRDVLLVKDIHEVILEVSGSASEWNLERGMLLDEIESLSTDNTHMIGYLRKLEKQIDNERSSIKDDIKFLRKNISVQKRDPLLVDKLASQLEKLSEISESIKKIMCSIEMFKRTSENMVLKEKDMNWSRDTFHSHRLSKPVTLDDLIQQIRDAYSRMADRDRVSSCRKILDEITKFSDGSLSHSAGQVGDSTTVSKTFKETSTTKIITESAFTEVCVSEEMSKVIQDRTTFAEDLARANERISEAEHKLEKLREDVRVFSDHINSEVTTTYYTVSSMSLWLEEEGSDEAVRADREAKVKPDITTDPSLKAVYHNWLSFKEILLEVSLRLKDFSLKKKKDEVLQFEKNATEALKAITDLEGHRERSSTDGARAWSEKDQHIQQLEKKVESHRSLLRRLQDTLEGTILHYENQISILTQKQLEADIISSGNLNESFTSTSVPMIDGIDPATDVNRKDGNISCKGSLELISDWIEEDFHDQLQCRISYIDGCLDRISSQTCYRGSTKPPTCGTSSDKTPPQLCAPREMVEVLIRLGDLLESQVRYQSKITLVLNNTTEHMRSAVRAHIERNLTRIRETFHSVPLDASEILNHPNDDLAGLIQRYDQLLARVYEVIKRATENPRPVPMETLFDTFGPVHQAELSYSTESIPNSVGPSFSDSRSSRYNDYDTPISAEELVTLKSTGTQTELGTSALGGRSKRRSDQTHFGFRPIEDENERYLETQNDSLVTGNEVAETIRLFCDLERTHGYVTGLFRAHMAVQSSVTTRILQAGLERFGEDLNVYKDRQDGLPNSKFGSTMNHMIDDLISNSNSTLASMLNIITFSSQEPREDGAGGSKRIYGVDGKDLRSALWLTRRKLEETERMYQELLLSAEELYIRLQVKTKEYASSQGELGTIMKDLERAEHLKEQFQEENQQLKDLLAGLSENGIRPEEQQAVEEAVKYDKAESSPSNPDTDPSAVASDDRIRVQSKRSSKPYLTPRYVSASAASRVAEIGENDSERVDSDQSWDVYPSTSGPTIVPFNDFVLSGLLANDDEVTIIKVTQDELDRRIQEFKQYRLPDSELIDDIQEEIIDVIDVDGSKSRDSASTQEEVLCKESYSLEHPLQGNIEELFSSPHPSHELEEVGKEWVDRDDFVRWLLRRVDFEDLQYLVKKYLNQDSGPSAVRMITENPVDGERCALVMKDSQSVSEMDSDSMRGLDTSLARPPFVSTPRVENTPSEGEQDRSHESGYARLEKCVHSKDGALVGQPPSKIPRWRGPLKKPQIEKHTAYNPSTAVPVKKSGDRHWDCFPATPRCKDPSKPSASKELRVKKRQRVPKLIHGHHIFDPSRKRLKKSRCDGYIRKPEPPIIIVTSADQVPEDAPDWSHPESRLEYTNRSERIRHTTVDVSTTTSENFDFEHFLNTNESLKKELNHVQVELRELRSRYQDEKKLTVEKLSQLQKELIIRDQELFEVCEMLKDNPPKDCTSLAVQTETPRGDSAALEDEEAESSGEESLSQVLTSTDSRGTFHDELVILRRTMKRLRISRSQEERIRRCKEMTDNMESLFDDMTQKMLTAETQLKEKVAENSILAESLRDAVNLAEMMSSLQQEKDVESIQIKQELASSLLSLDRTRTELRSKTDQLEKLMQYVEAQQQTINELRNRIDSDSDDKEFGGLEPIQEELEDGPPHEEFLEEIEKRNKMLVSLLRLCGHFNIDEFSKDDRSIDIDLLNERINATQAWRADESTVLETEFRSLKKNILLVASLGSAICRFKHNDDLEQDHYDMSFRSLHIDLRDEIQRQYNLARNSLLSNLRAAREHVVESLDPVWIEATTLLSDMDPSCVCAGCSQSLSTSPFVRVWLCLADHVLLCTTLADERTAAVEMADSLKKDIKEIEEALREKQKLINDLSNQTRVNSELRGLCVHHRLEATSNRSETSSYERSPDHSRSDTDSSSAWFHQIMRGLLAENAASETMASAVSTDRSPASPPAEDSSTTPPCETDPGVDPVPSDGRAEERDCVFCQQMQIIENQSQRILELTEDVSRLRKITNSPQVDSESQP